MLNKILLLLGFFSLFMAGLVIIEYKYIAIPFFIIGILFFMLEYNIYNWNIDKEHKEYLKDINLLRNIKCYTCDKIFETKHGLNIHKSRMHTN